MTFLNAEVLHSEGRNHLASRCCASAEVELQGRGEMLHCEALVRQQDIIVDAAHNEHRPVVGLVLAGRQTRDPDLKGQGPSRAPVCRGYTMT